MATLPVQGGPEGPTLLRDLDYSVLKDRCREFLRDFRVDTTEETEREHRLVDSLESEPTEHDEDEYGSLRGFKYLQQLKAIANRTSKVLKIELDDVIAYGDVYTDDANEASTGIHLAEEIIGNTKRFVDLFAAASDELLDKEAGLAVNHTVDELNDPIDILMESRQRRQRELEEQERRMAQGFGLVSDDPSTTTGGQETPASNINDPNGIPAALLRRFQVVFIPPSGEKPVCLREIRAEHVGKLVSLKAIVTRVTEVKPRVIVAGYTCDTCGFEVYQEVKSRQFLPLTVCPNPEHKENKTPSRLNMNVATTKFAKFQEVKIQECSDQVPVGAIPRRLAVQMTGELTRMCTAGDIVQIAGVFLPVPYSGYQALRAGLLSDTFIEAFHVEQLRKSYEREQVSTEMHEKVDQVIREGDVYERLSQSIAPEIYGHADLKKALLLLLVSAPERCLVDGMRLRGDLHICLMGDPGVAKSQLLKYIARATPRGVYTTGKGSSGVGLTAAVVRDSVTNELMLEGGALILADKGICCIDEFDKMNEVDRTAIHEVMEQQTVSIAKAGITTTLNARAAVLAAANPAFGRYNRKRTPAQNINLPAALLSRFDLLFLLLDEADLDKDLRLAQHVTFVHRTGHNPPLDFEPLEMPLLRAYISRARSTPDPVIPDDGLLADYIVSNYVARRIEEQDQGKYAAGYTTARSLLSIMRLAQALARLRFSSEITQGDVDESIRLVSASKSSLYDEDGEDGGDGRNKERDPVSAIYALVRSIASAAHVATGSDDEDDGESDEDEDDNEGDDFGDPDLGSRKRKTRSSAVVGAGVRASKIKSMGEKRSGKTMRVSKIESRVLAAGYTREQLEDCLLTYDELNVWSYDQFAQKLRFIA